MTRLTSFALGCCLAVTCCYATLAGAEEDDDLAPLTLKKPPAKAPPPAKKPAVPPPARKPPPAKPPAHAADDDLTPLSPVVSRGEVTVRVAANISGAVLAVDNKELGTLPLGPQSLSTGEHLVTVKRPGFATFVKKVNIVVGKPVELEAKLAPVAAVLSVTSDVADAQVLVNGRIIGTAPITDHEVPPGVVEIAVIKEGFREDKQKLTLVAGRDYPVVVKFNPGAARTVAANDRPIETQLVPNAVEPGPMAISDAPTVTPITQRWYFWVGVAAVVAAAAAGTAVGVTAAQPPRKRTEGEICTSKCAACIGLSCTGANVSGLSF